MCIPSIRRALHLGSRKPLCLSAPHTFTNTAFGQEDTNFFFKSRITTTYNHTSTLKLALLSHFYSSPNIIQEAITT